MQPELHPKALKLLEQAGWFPGRKINPSHLAVHYKAKNMVLVPQAFEFLEEFLGLSLTHRSVERVDPNSLRYMTPEAIANVIDFNADFDIESELLKPPRLYDSFYHIEDHAAELKSVLGRDVAWLGIILDFYTSSEKLFVDDKGNYFISETCDFFALVGRNKYETINNLVLEKVIYAIPIEEEIKKQAP